MFGVSYDSEESLKSFKEKYHLPFTFLSDSTKRVSELYGVKGIFGPSRKTFVIDMDFTIVKYFDSVDVTTHSKDILESLEPGPGKN